MKALILIVLIYPNGDHETFREETRLSGVTECAVVAEIAAQNIKNTLAQYEIQISEIKHTCKEIAS